MLACEFLQLSGYAGAATWSPVPSLCGERMDRRVSNLPEVVRDPIQELCDPVAFGSVEAEQDSPAGFQGRLLETHLCVALNGSHERCDCFFHISRLRLRSDPRSRTAGDRCACRSRTPREARSLPRPRRQRLRTTSCRSTPGRSPRFRPGTLDGARQSSAGPPCRPPRPGWPRSWTPCAQPISGELATGSSMREHPLPTGRVWACRGAACCRTRQLAPSQRRKASIHSDPAGSGESSGPKALYSGVEIRRCRRSDSFRAA